MVFAAIGSGSWVWSDKTPDSDGTAVVFNFHTGSSAKIYKDNLRYSVRAFATATSYISPVSLSAAPSISPAEVEHFIDQVLGCWSNDLCTPDDFGYEDSVYYYGTPNTKRIKVFNDKQDFRKRWPESSFKRIKSTRQHLTGESSLAIAFEVEFDLESSKGTLVNSWTVVRKQEHLRIIAEDQRLILRSPVKREPQVGSGVAEIEPGLKSPTDSIQANKAFSDKVPVAVLDIIDGDRMLRPNEWGALNELVHLDVAAKSNFVLIPRGEMRKVVKREQAQSYRECYDETCQIELGRELAAQKLVVAKILRTPARCSIGIQMLDLTSATYEATVADDVSCNYEAIEFGLKQLVSRLFGKQTEEIPVPTIQERQNNDPVDDDVFRDFVRECNFSCGTNGCAEIYLKRAEEKNTMCSKIKYEPGALTEIEVVALQFCKGHKTNCQRLRQTDEVSVRGFDAVTQSLREDFLESLREEVGLKVVEEWLRRAQLTVKRPKFTNRAIKSFMECLAIHRMTNQCDGCEFSFCEVRMY